MQMLFELMSVTPDFISKSIKVEFSNDIDERTINSDNFRIYDNVNKHFVACDISIANEYATAVLNEYPAANNSYTLYVSQNIKDIAEQPLQGNLVEDFVFDSSISSTIKITQPADMSVLSVLNIVFTEVPVNGSSKINNYLLQISTNSSFNDIIKETQISEKSEITVNNLKDGQYYLRMRVQSGDKYGLWSETISFVLSSDPSQIDDGEPSFIKNLNIEEVPQNFADGSSFKIEFSDNIDPSSLNIRVRRKDIC